MNINSIKNIKPKDITDMMQEHSMLASGIIGALVILIGGYFSFTMLFQNSGLTRTSANDPKSLLVGVNDRFAQLVNVQGTLSFKEMDILNLARVKELRDFSEKFISNVRGRDDPFTPYAITGSSR